jgi:hypothetical protein
VIPARHRATPTTHLLPPTRRVIVCSGPVRAWIHPPPDLASGQLEGRRMPGLPHADTRAVCGGLALSPRQDEGRRFRGLPCEPAAFRSRPLRLLPGEVRSAYVRRRRGLNGD